MSKLSTECLRNKGLCCENRIPLILEDGTIVKRCPSFKKPYCTIYPKRPLDCKAYPVTVGKVNGEVVFLVDRRCPAVRKGIVDMWFINRSIKLFQHLVLDDKFMDKNCLDNEASCYDWITVEQYKRKRRQVLRRHTGFGYR